MNNSRRLVVSIDDQVIRLIEGGICLREFPVSTSIKGMGFVKDSYRTPTGNFRICAKIGAGHPSGTIFKARVPVGQWHPGDSPDADLVLTRILRLDGLDAANANTMGRCIYVHGTNREDLIGRPAGHGCVRLRNDDMIVLFDMVEENDLLEIQPATRRRGKLLFIGFDSLLVSLDGFSAMAEFRGEDIRSRVAEISAACRARQIDPGMAFRQSMEYIRPTRELCGSAASCCVAALSSHAYELVGAAKEGGWLPVLLANCPVPVVEPVAKELGITHFEAPALVFHEDGSCADSGLGYSSTGCFQQSGVIKDWVDSVLPERLAMLGDFSYSHGNGYPVDATVLPCLPSDLGIEGFDGLALSVLTMDNPS